MGPRASIDGVHLIGHMGAIHDKFEVCTVSADSLDSVHCRMVSVAALERLLGQ